MNFGQFLVGLGCTTLPDRKGLPCPAVITSREPARIGSSAMIETAEQVAAQLDSEKTVASRATTKRSPGNWF